MHIPGPRTVVRQLREAPRIVRLLIAEQFFESFVPVAALYALMFERIGGLDFAAIGWLFAIWSLGYLVAELPSGILADYWSRRNVIVLGGVLRACGFALWLIWPGFAGYAAGFALWGVSIACTSGSFAAYMHDELRARGQHRLYTRYYGWTMSAASIGMLTGYVLAAILTLQYATLLISLGLVSSLLFGLCLAVAGEHPYRRESSYVRTLLAGSREIRHNRRLRYICTVLFSIFMTLGVLEELLPRMFAGFGLSDRWVAGFVALSFLASVFLLARLELFARFSLARQVLAMAAGLAVLTAAMVMGGLGASLPVLAFSLIFYVFRPLFIHHVQTVSTSDQRATIGSIPGLAAGLLGAGAYVLLGAASDRLGEAGSIAWYAGIWAGVFVWLAYVGRRHPRIPAGDLAADPPTAAAAP